MPRVRDVTKNGVGKPCCYCKRSMASSQYNNDPDPWLRGVSATVEHIEPRAMGGDNSERNLAAACQRCNNLRGHLNHVIFSKFARHVLQAYPNAPTVFLRASLQRFVVSLAELAIENRRETNRALGHCLLTLHDDLKRHNEI